MLSILLFNHDWHGGGDSSFNSFNLHSARSLFTSDSLFLRRVLEVLVLQEPGLVLLCLVPVPLVWLPVVDGASAGALGGVAGGGVRGGGVDEAGVHRALLLGLAEAPVGGGGGGGAVAAVHPAPGLAPARGGGGGAVLGAGGGDAIRVFAHTGGGAG